IISLPPVFRGFVSTMTRRSGLARCRGVDVADDATTAWPPRAAPPPCGTGAMSRWPYSCRPNGPSTPAWAPLPVSRGDAGEVEADDAGQDQADRHQLHGGHGVAEEGHADHRGARRADPGPYRVGGPDLEVAQ